MNDSSGQMLYKKGENLVLDRQFERYRKMRLWRGNAIHEVFSDDEFDNFADLWRKDRNGIRKLRVKEVFKLIELADMIIA